MLKITNLTKNFGSVRALDNLSLTVKEGEIYALIGPNGAGKTTTLKIIAGLYLPTQGSVEFLGKDILKDDAAEKRSIGYIPDEPIFYPGLTGMEFLNFIAALYKVSDRRKNEVITQFSKI